MAPSEIKRKETSQPRHRSHKGCWTCKRKRIQCDETQPGCHRCTSRGLVCEGYGIRLRWGAGIASRGRFNGAEKPIKESIPPPSKRRWDLRTQIESRENKDHLGQPIVSESDGSQYNAQSESLYQSISKRPTVNILNAPYDQGSDLMGISKHFELPVSMGSLVSVEGELLNGRTAAPQRTQRFSGRSAAIATL